MSSRIHIREEAFVSWIAVKRVVRGTLAIGYKAGYRLRLMLGVTIGSIRSGGFESSFSFYLTVFIGSGIVGGLVAKVLQSVAVKEKKREE